jgi:hypothetical protein
MNEEEFKKSMKGLLNVPPPDKDKRHKKKSMRTTLPLDHGRTDDIRLTSENSERYTILIIHNYEELSKVKTKIGFYWTKMNENGTDYISFMPSYTINEKYNVFFIESSIEPDIELL